MARESTPTTMCAPERQVDIHARAEADEADAFAGADQRALVREAHDPPGDEACDLHHAKPPGRRIDDDAVALIVLARLVEIGAEEQPGVIDDLGDAALDRARDSRGNRRPT